MGEGVQRSMRYVFSKSEITLAHKYNTFFFWKMEGGREGQKEREEKEGRNI